MPTTTIQIDVEVRDELRSRGRMGESYNDVVRRLLDSTRPRGLSRSELRAELSGPQSKPWVPLQDRD